MRRRAVLGLVAGGLLGLGGCARRQPDVPRSAPEHPGDEGRGGEDDTGDTDTPPAVTIPSSEFVERNGFAILVVTARNTSSQPRRVVLVANVAVDGTTERLQQDVTFDPGETKDIEFPTGADWEQFDGSLEDIERHPVDLSTES